MHLCMSASASTKLCCYEKKGGKNAVSVYALYYTCVRVCVRGAECRCQSPSQPSASGGSACDPNELLVVEERERGPSLAF